MSEAPLVLYNTRTRAKERFVPLEAGGAGIYTCGPTVYAPQHVGNMRSQLFADLLKRTLLAEGFEVRHVINVTDVGHLVDDGDDGEDKIEAAARRSGRSAREIADLYTAQWQRDRSRLGCLEPEVLCRATDHIAEQIALVEALEARGLAYRLEDGLYFDTARFPRYAEFARLDLEGQVEGARVETAGVKRSPSDFALWKFAAPGVKRQQEWDSPWGRGFPGWHVECSAMSRCYLGDHFDIHTGGIDHIQVHHTNEIAQSEGAWAEAPWVRFWMHNEFLNLTGEKMAKSAGNVWVLDDLLERGFLARSFRYFFLQAHYRQQQAFTLDAMEAADRGYRRLLAHAIDLRRVTDEADPALVAAWLTRFRAEMRDDLNAPRAMAVAWEVVRSGRLGPAERRALLLAFDEWLGLDLAEAELPVADADDPRIDALLVEREEARKRRDFARADAIRDELAAEGVRIEDTPEGPRWSRS